MPVNSRVDIFTTAMRAEFIKAYQATAEPAPWEKVTQVIPSTARIEHYSYMTPVPGVSRYQGFRRYGNLDSIRYSVENLEYDNGFEVLLRDIEDDQVGGYSLKASELADRMKLFPGRAVIKNLSLAETVTCFDGSAMAATSHTIGSGDNLRSFNGAANDGATYNLAALYHGGRLKPLIWQNRKPAKFMTNSGTPQSEEAKRVRYWADMEGAAAFGYWWNLVWVNITDLPTVAEMHTIFATIEGAFRSFTLPKSLNTEDGEYPFEQVEFNASNLTMVGSTGLAEVLRQALNSDWVPQGSLSGSLSGIVAVTNRFKGFADYFVSAFMN